MRGREEKERGGGGVIVVVVVVIVIVVLVLVVLVVVPAFLVVTVIAFVLTIVVLVGLTRRTTTLCVLLSNRPTPSALALAVFDGVGGWAEEGIDPAWYSSELRTGVQQAAEKGEADPMLLLSAG